MQLDDATQQNAALVEQASASARSLQEQANALASAAARFRLHDGPAGHRAPLSAAAPQARRPATVAA